MPGKNTIRFASNSRNDNWSKTRICPSLFIINLVLEKAIRDSGIQRTDTVFYKSVQLLAYADDTDIIARTPIALKEAFLTLERAARKMGLQINEQKKKYMVAGHSQSKGENTENTFDLDVINLKKWIPSYILDHQ
jgi:hypothetical protein